MHARLFRYGWWGLAAAAFALLVFFSFSHLTESPPTWYDEGLTGQVALNYALYGEQVAQMAPGEFTPTALFLTTGYPVLVPVGLFMRYFGADLFHARIVMALFIIAAAVAMFAFVVRRWGLPLGCAALWLVVTFAPLYGQGKNILGEVPGLFFMMLFLLCVNALEQRLYRGTYLYVTAGICAGLCVATKPIFILLGGAVLVALLLKRKTIAWHPAELTAGVLAFALPLLLWVLLTLSHPVPLAQILQFYANPAGYANSATQIVPNLLRFMRETSPMYFLLLMLAWLASVGVRLRAKKEVSLAELIALLYAVLVWVAFLRTQGYYRYYFPAEIPALIFLPSSLSIVIARVSFFWFERFKKIAVGFIIMICILVQTYPLLFSSWTAVHAGSTTARDYAAYFASLPPRTSLYVYDAPQIVLFLPTQNYYQYFAPTQQFLFGADTLPLLSRGVPDMLVVNSVDWPALATSTFSRYTMVRSLSGVIVAKRK